MLKNLVEETANNPGTGSTVTLGGAPAGRQTWRGAGFTNGAQVFYFITDGIIGEWGIGTLTLGASDTISRDTVLSNTSGTTNRLNFTGTCRVYNSLPAERALFVNAGGLSIDGDLVVSKAQPTVFLDKTSSGQSAAIWGRRSGSARWSIELGNGTAEGTGNAGSDFAISRFNDSGQFINAPVFVNRSTGAVTLGTSGVVSFIQGGVDVSGGVTAAGTVTSRTSGSTGFARLESGDASNPGIVSFYTAEGTRRGYIGWQVGTARLTMQAEGGWSWGVTGLFYTYNDIVNESGNIRVRNAANRHLWFENAAGGEQAVFWNGTDNTQSLRVGGSGGKTWQWLANGQHLLPALNSNTAQNDTVGSIQVQNVSGTGENSVAAMTFLCQGQYGLKMHLRSDGYFGIGGWSAAAWRWYVNNTTGEMTAAGNIAAYSDPRLKDDVEKIDGALDIVGKLDGVRYTWNGKSKLIGHAGKRDIGVLADQVEEVLPELVSLSIADPDTQERYRTVAYDKLVPVLIEAIKELKARVEELEGQK